MKPANGLNVLLLRSSAAVAPDPASLWRLTLTMQTGATFVSDPVPLRFSRFPGRLWKGDSPPAQLFPTYPNPAISVDLATGNGTQQIRYPRLPSRVVSSPTP